MDWTFDHLVVPFMKIWRHKWPLLHLAPNVGLTDEDGDATIRSSSYYMNMNCECEMSRAVSRLWVISFQSCGLISWTVIVNRTGVDPDIVHISWYHFQYSHCIPIACSRTVILHPGLDAYMPYCLSRIPNWHFHAFRRIRVILDTPTNILTLWISTHFIILSILCDTLKFCAETYYYFICLVRHLYHMNLMHRISW